MKSLKIRIASLFLSILIVFNPVHASYARQFSLKKLFFATFGIYFKDDQKQIRHRNRVNNYKKKIYRQKSKLWSRKIYILGINDPIIQENIKSYFELNKLENKKYRLNLKDLKRIEQLIENTNKFDYVKVSFNYSSTEEQIIIYIKMPVAFSEVTLVNKAAHKMPYSLITKAIEPFITSRFDNSTLSRFSTTVKDFYKYLGYDYFFIRSYVINNKQLIINMDEHRINQFSLIGTIYFCKDDFILTKNLNDKIPLDLVSQRFCLRENGSINTNYADRAVESLKSDLIVDVCRYEIDYIEGRKSPLDVCIFMTSLAERSGFFSIYPIITPHIIYQLLERRFYDQFSQANENIYNINYLNNYPDNNTNIAFNNLLTYYSYYIKQDYCQFSSNNIFFDIYHKFILHKIKHIAFAYYDLRNLIRKTDHLSLEMNLPSINNDFKLIYKDLWTNLGKKNLGITKFTLLSSKETQRTSYFISFNDLLNNTVTKNLQRNDYYIIKEILTKLETKHQLFNFLSIYNKFSCQNKKYKILEILNSDNLLCNHQLLLNSNKPSLLWIPITKKISQTLYIFNWSFIYHRIQDINSLYKGIALYVDFINMYSNLYVDKIKRTSPYLINLIKFKQVFFIPFTVDDELKNHWSGLFNIDVYYILQNSTKIISRSHILSYINTLLIDNKKVQNSFPSNDLSCEIHKRIKPNISVFGGLMLGKTYFNEITPKINQSRLNFSILIGITLNIPIQDVQPIYIYYGIPIYGRTNKIGFKMSLYPNVYQNLNKQI